jgi:hypothetical protein
MTIAYHVRIDWDDDGDHDSAGEDVSAAVIALEWRLGFDAAYQPLAPPGRALITLDNRDGQFSPEPAAFAPGKALRISADDGGGERMLFAGFIEYIEADTGVHGSRAVRLRAATFDAQFDGMHVTLPPLAVTDAGSAIARLLDGLPLRRASLADLWRLGEPDFSRLDLTARVVADSPVTQVIEQGATRLVTVGVGWREDQSPARAITALVGAERGRFYADREGRACFLNRHHALLAMTAQAAIALDAEAIDYDFGADQISAVRVRFVPRAVGAAGATLWTLASSQRVNPGVQRLTIGFRDAAGTPIGALALEDFLYAANLSADGSGDSVTLTVVVTQTSAVGAELELRNDTGLPVFLLAGARLTGTPLLLGDPAAAVHADVGGQVSLLPRALELDLALIADFDDADQIARFELARRAPPRGAVRSVTLSARAHGPAIFERTLFDRVTIADAHTGHHADYLIIGEAHQVEAGGHRHQARWWLEPAHTTEFWLLGVGRLGEHTTLAY